MTEQKYVCRACGKRWAEGEDPGECPEEWRKGIHETYMHTHVGETPGEPSAKKLRALANVALKRASTKVRASLRPDVERAIAHAIAVALEDARSYPHDRLSHLSHRAKAWRDLVDG